MEDFETDTVFLEGTVARIVFQNKDNGWTVLELETDEELHTAVGILPGVGVGEFLELKGNWIEHPRFGVQLKVEKYRKQEPTTGEAILKYLSSGVIKGIGPATAARVVEKFGKDSLNIIENHPEKLSQIRGITKERAQDISEEYQRQTGLREVMLAFAEYGITPSEALRSYRRWGDNTIANVRENPYILCSKGMYISFDRADEISAGMGKPSDDFNRAKAGVKHILRHNTGNGHTCLPRNKLSSVTATLLGEPEETIDVAITDMIINLALRNEVIKDREFIFLNNYYDAEKYIATRIKSLGNSIEKRGKNFKNVDSTIDIIEKRHRIKYADRQRDAIEKVAKKGSLILTGGPGTGKTTTLTAIIELLESYGDNVVLAAPTGRAAQRMSELTNREAKTIHRLLEVQWDENDTTYFARDESNPLEGDAFVIDEVSMVDVLLFESLLRAIKAGSKLILVGDYDQLPAVGAGSVLHDLMKTDVLPVVELSEVFRQALESNIVKSAHEIVSGKTPELYHKNGDLFFMPRTTPHDTLETILSLCERRLPEAYGLSIFENLQILSPSRKGELGIISLNNRIQDLLNPPKENLKEINFIYGVIREGDKVMHTRNNYNIEWERDDGSLGQGVFNGDIGIVEKINTYNAQISVRYEDRVAVYTGEEVKDLELAYAITVHKSQGSEFDAVVLSVFNTPNPLCYRNLLYTAVTRAKKLLIIVGSESIITQMINNDRQTKRYSGLYYFLIQPENSIDTFL